MTIMKLRRTLRQNLFFEQGVISLKDTLPQYDAAGYSYYDIYKTPARKKYHEIHIQELGRLFNITNEKVFEEYQVRWRNHTQPQFIPRLITQPTRTGGAIFTMNFVLVLSIIELLYFTSRRMRNRG